MKWITRKDIKVDRVACPWLIKRFVDPQAEFLFVEEKDLLIESKRQSATPFDDPAVQRLGLIVRAADVKGQEGAAPEGIGLRSIAQGFAAMGLSDEERLARQLPVYDALYAYVQRKHQ